MQSISGTICDSQLGGGKTPKMLNNSGDGICTSLCSVQSFTNYPFHQQEGSMCQLCHPLNAIDEVKSAMNWCFSGKIYRYSSEKLYSNINKEKRKITNGWG